MKNTSYNTLSLLVENNPNYPDDYNPKGKMSICAGEFRCLNARCSTCPFSRKNDPKKVVTMGDVRKELQKRRREVTESHKGGGGVMSNGIGICSGEGVVPEPISTIEDMVNQPSHYTSGGIECLDAIQSSMTEEAFNGFLKGNVMKYIWRYEKKINPLEDLRKAQWYLNKLETILEKAKQTHGEAVPKG